MIGLNVKIAGDRYVWVVVKDDGEFLVVRYRAASGETRSKRVHRHDVTWREEPDVGWVPTAIELYTG